MINKLPWQFQLGAVLLLPSFASLILFTWGYLSESNFDYRYLLPNLFLAWLPLVFIFWLIKILDRKRWSSWEGLTASILWLLFLPNSFYIISDLIHLQEANSSTVTYDALMMSGFVFTGLALGFSSLYIFHSELTKRLKPNIALIWLALIILACSFAIYIGRDLRWNSWDALFRPGWLLLDISDSLITPGTYAVLLRTTFSFWLLLSSFYGAVLWIVKLFSHSRQASKLLDIAS
jgi:uncharacterized membrane protein